MRRVWLNRNLIALSAGGVTLGILQSIEAIRFSDIITTFLAQLFSLLVALLFGGNADALTGGGGSGF